MGTLTQIDNAYSSLVLLRFHAEVKTLFHNTDESSCLFFTERFVFILIFTINLWQIKSDTPIASAASVMLGQKSRLVFEVLQQN